MRQRLFLILCLWGFSAVNPVRAELLGSWQLQGKLQLSANVKGKSVSVRHKDFIGLTAEFTQDMQCQIQSTAFSISNDCTWMNNKFKVKMLPTAAKAMHKSIEQDLKVKTGKTVLITDADSIVFSGSEAKTGRLKGQLKGSLLIKTRTLFLDHDNLPGRLTLRYDFIGTRMLNPAAAQVQGE